MKGIEQPSVIAHPSILPGSGHGALNKRGTEHEEPTTVFCVWYPLGPLLLLDIQFPSIATYSSPLLLLDTQDTTRVISCSQVSCTAVKRSSGKVAWSSPPAWHVHDAGSTCLKPSELG
jgi:hypothetical protein